MNNETGQQSNVLKTAVKAPLSHPMMPAQADIPGGEGATAASAPSVFQYTDYREFLRDAYEHKRRRNPAFTESAFVRKTGLSSNSRGYFKLVVQGKRNLSAATIRGFAEALDLSTKESLYFENLVHFNQAEKPRDKNYYFQRLVASAEGTVSKQFDLLVSQYSYFSCWYLPAVRELVGLSAFKEDPAWIVAKLRGKISKAQAIEALQHLERLGMIKRSLETSRWEQSEPLVKYAGGVFNYAVQKFQSDMLDRAKESLVDDPYEERRASALTLSCDRERLPEIVRMVDEFRDALNLKFGVGSKAPDTVFQIGFQIFQLTPIQDQKKER